MRKLGLTPRKVALLIGGLTAAIVSSMAVRKCLRLLVSQDPLTANVIFIRNKIKENDPAAGVVPLKFIQRCFVQGYDGLGMYAGIVQGLNSKITSTIQQPKNPFLPPFEKGIHICDIGGSHRIIKNKFPIVQGHLLLITVKEDSQLTPLSKAELLLVLSTLRAMEKPALAFFNRGKNSGYSQNHKHIQIVPITDRMHIIKEIQESVSLMCSNSLIKPDDKIVTEFQKFSFFRHGLIALRLDLDSAQQIGDALQQAYNSLMTSVREGDDESYNFLMTEQFMLLIPRRQQFAFNNISLNSLAFTGSVGVRTEAQLSVLRNSSMKQVLGDITFKRDL